MGNHDHVQELLVTRLEELTVLQDQGSKPLPLVCLLIRTF